MLCTTAINTSNKIRTQTGIDSVHLQILLNGHVLTMWFMVQSQEGDWARPDLCTRTIAELNSSSEHMYSNGSAKHQPSPIVSLTRVTNCSIAWELVGSPWQM